MKKNKLIIIGGPTGSGKTDLSIKVASQVGCSIISADSRQVFKELTIGSAAPVTDQLSKVPHYFVGSHSLRDSFNAGIFTEETLSLLSTLFKENPVQVVCGGSGLYIESLIHGMDELPNADLEIRTSLKQLLESQGIEALKSELQEKDPTYYTAVDFHNPQRLLRALEVIRITGKPYSELRTSKKVSRPFEVCYYAIDLPRENLYKRINERTDKMLQKGWLEETKNLIEYRNLNALQTVGYKELFQFLDGNISFERAVELIKQNTRRYAKRQLTWLRGRENIEWLDESMISDISRLI